MIPVVRHGRWQASSFCVHSFFLSQSKTPEWCSVVFPPFLLRPKKNCLEMQYQEIIRKKHGKKPSGKKLEVFLLMIFLWGSKILRKQGDFLKFTRLRPCAFHDFLLEKHKAQTTPLKLILRYENPIQEIQETCAALDHSPGRNSTFLMDFGLIDFLCLGKILSSAVSACCFSEKPSKVVVFDGIFYRHQPVVIRP